MGRKKKSRKRRKEKSKMALYVLSFVGVGILGTVGFFGIKNDKKQREYVREISPLCTQVRREFDNNPQDGKMDYNEGIKLARAAGYGGNFPDDQLVIQLQPGSYRNHDVVLRMSRLRSMDISKENSPIWNAEYRFPKSRLAELVRRPQRR